MNLLVSEAGSEDFSRIHGYLSVSADAAPYHHIQWLQAVKKAYGFDYDYLFAEIDGLIVGVLPVCRFKSLTGKSSLCSLPFCDIGGVVADSDEIKEKLIDYALDLVDQLPSTLLELRQRGTDLLEEGIDLTNRKVSMLLELPASAEILLAGFKSKLRSQVKKAEKNGLKFDFANDAKSIDDFFYVFSRNMHLLGSPTHSIKWFQALSETYQNDMLVGRVWFEGKIVGAGVLLFSGTNVSIPWASTLRDYNRLAPNMMLYWNLLRVSCERGCKLFDFGRSTYGEGTYKFKLQWGAKPVLLDWRYLDKQGDLKQAASHKSKVREVVETVWRKLPFSVVNMIGPYMRRHISL
jgi:FemAB-related protein (PEP-CTERM system-associated)